MDTPQSATTPSNLKSPAPVAWDNYFPLLNKLVLFSVLIFGTVLATGVDLSKLTDKLVSSDVASSSATSAVSTPVPAVSRGLSLSVTGPGGWKNAVIIIVVLAAVAAVALSLLSRGGRDAAWTREQEAKKKEDQKVAPATKASTAASPVEEEECNLASYKLFFPTAEKTPESAAVAEKTSV